MLLADPRVDVRFTVDTAQGGSAFSHGLPDHLIDAGARFIPWVDVLARRFDLALAASDKTDLDRLQAPVVLMPHGAGYHRRAADDPTRISGLRESALVTDGRVVPHTIVVAHHHQADTLKAIDPRLADHTVVAADPCLDRIVAGEVHRYHHRRSFDADDRRMVLLCSTWGVNSLFGTDLRLAERLVTTLPADHHRVVMTLHPNIWRRHGSLRISAWLRRAVDAGLVLLPQDEDWRPALIAADVVVSDHGSLTCYAAAARRPVLIAADGGPEVVPGSPLARLLSALPRLDVDRIAEPPEPVASPLVDAIFTRQSTPTITEVFYRIMGLSLPATVLTTEPVPLGRFAVPSPTHYRSTVTHARIENSHAHLTLERTTARHDAPGSLSTADTTLDIAALETASAIWSEASFPDQAKAVAHARSILTAFPGTRITTASADVVVAVLRTGLVITAHSTTTLSATTAALHWWSTLPPADRPDRVTVDAGAESGAIILL